jgi:hypothetical protein
MKQDRKAFTQRDDATGELRQALAQLERRVARVEEELEFVEQLQPSAQPRQLEGTDTQAD